MFGEQENLALGLLPPPPCKTCPSTSSTALQEWEGPGPVLCLSPAGILYCPVCLPGQGTRRVLILPSHTCSHLACPAPLAAKPQPSAASEVSVHLAAASALMDSTEAVNTTPCRSCLSLQHTVRNAH
jgi:hypothetical protein